MEKEFIVELNDSQITDYDQLLSRFSNWKQYKREINLNQLLESGKKIEFEVDIPNSQSVFYIDIEYSPSPISSLSGACAVIDKLTFIILENKILDLKINTRVLKTHYGKILEDIIESGLELKLLQNVDIEGQITKFYLDSPKQAA